ncbi:ribosome recycling factor [Daldinia vernicosa]|uniref:ribosome recycling factor n=1 Tax=Daldinia vernicosa TaxID=114800 RepID=UPI0020088990|nr:ribosome recycling factor [Daldinia vernicosa]KAI0849641.1 ribosome recycling factor [Daldinia vernicosa]
MRATATRTLLRQSRARPELGRVHDIIRPRCVLDTTTTTTTPLSLRPCILLLPQHPAGSGNLRALHTTSPVWKSKAPKDKTREDHKKQASAPRGSSSSSSSSGDAEADDPNGPKHPPANPEEPLNFADVESRIRRSDEHHRELLKKLRVGGRFNPDVVGALRVQPDRKDPSVTYPLREVAQVISRGGRTISLIAHEAAYVKPIMSAVQASADFNQQPQRDPDNELELILKIEPETRDDLLRRAKAVCNDWRDRVRSVRQKRDKQHVTWRKNNEIGPDLKRTADKELDKIIKAKMVEIDDLEKDTLKSLPV